MTILIFLVGVVVTTLVSAFTVTSVWSMRLETVPTSD
jgi:hypothetical protein